MKINNFFKLVIAVGICEMAGIVGSVFTISSIPNWYAGLEKPSFSPPNWIFGPVWITLYFLMGVAAFLIWSSRKKASDRKRRKEIKIALSLFGVQLFLNVAWSIIFFGLKNPGWALFEIIILWLAILATIVAFSKISRLTVWLLLPYILWVSFAAYLNYAIFALNQEKPIACTEEAKLCQDGSYVSRIAPQCDFAFCPKENLIQVEIPKVNEAVSSPLTIKGRARGFWFFEADFPIKLFDENGELLATAIARAQGEWMTEDFVSFEAELKFAAPKTEKGSLVLEKDNPSGLSEHADELRIPVVFAKETKKINLYYYNSEADKDESGNIECSRGGLAAVEREIPISQTPIQDSVNLLLLGKLTQEEQAQGISTEYPLEGFSLKGALLKNGILTLEFNDPNNKTVGGSCRVGILWFQIEATAKQFPEVQLVHFLPEDIFQP
ncbi:MAG: tryptophan-rich sensory protein [bacterium]